MKRLLLVVAGLAVLALFGRNAADLGWFDVPPTATATPVPPWVRTYVANRPDPTGTAMQLTASAPLIGYTPAEWRTPTVTPAPTDPIKRIYLADVPGVPAGVDEAAWHELRRYLDADDRTRYLDTIVTGRALFITTNTAVLLLERKGDLCRVRVAEGRHYGQAGWLLCQWVRERP
jgi:hypothetical protein